MHCNYSNLRGDMDKDARLTIRKVFKQNTLSVRSTCCTFKQTQGGINNSETEEKHTKHSLVDSLGRRFGWLSNRNRFGIKIFKGATI